MEVRPLTLADAGEMQQLVDRWIQFWHVPDNTTFPRMKEWITGPTVDLLHDSLSFWDASGLVAFGLVSLPPSDARALVALLAGVVDPERRGEGMGTELLVWQLARSRQRLVEAESEFPMLTRTWAWEWFDDTRALFERHGLQPVRQFDVMEKSLDGLEDENIPIGIEITPWDSTRMEEVRRVNNLAFSDHWGAVPISEVNWGHLLGSDQTRTALSRQALAEGAITGYTVSAVFPDNKAPTDRREAWVRILGVHPQWRKRGVGGALMRVTQNAFVNAGITHSILRVDAESPTGAKRLYEGLGYRTVHSSLTYEAPVSGDRA